MARPTQKLPAAEKDRAWKVANLRHWSTVSMRSIQYDKYKELFEIAAGKMNETAYQHITNPYHLKDDRFKRYPAKLANYDIISPKFLRWVSEYGERPFAPMVYSQSSNINNIKRDFLKQGIVESLQSKFINTLIAKGMFVPGAVDENGEPVQAPKHLSIIQKEAESLPDMEAIEGQRVLNYFMQDQQFDEKRRENFYNFIVTNFVSSYRDVIHDELVYGVVLPGRLDYLISPNQRYGERSEVIRAEYRFSLSEVLEIFGECMEKEELDQLIAKFESNGSGSFQADFFKYFRGGNESRQNHSTTTVNVVHIQWTGMSKIGKVTLPNGDETFVDEDYIPLFGENVEWRWVNCEHEGYVIDNIYYVGGDEVKYLRASFTNPYTTRKSYNFKQFMYNQYVEQIPVAVKMLQYQEAYNAIKYKIQLTVNKNKDKVMALPYSLLGMFTEKQAKEQQYDYDKGTNEDGTLAYKDNSDVAKHNNPMSNDNSPAAQAMYFMDATSTLFVNDAAPGVATALQLLKVLDMSLSNYISYLIEYAKSIKEECEELIGFNRFRMGNTKASDAVYNTQQGISGAELITEEYFREYEEFLTTDLQAILDLSKYAYRNGKKATFLRDDSEIEVLDIDKGYSKTQHGLFIANSGAIKQAYDLMKSQAVQFLQNGMKPTTFVKSVAKMAKGGNLESIIEDIENMEIKMMEEQQQAAQQEAANQQELQKLVNEDKERDRGLKKYGIDMDFKTELMKNFNMLESYAVSRGDTDLQGEIEKQRTTVMGMVNQNLLSMKQMQVDTANNIRDNEAKRYVADSALKVAKENKPAKA